ncbi:hypothetical protein [Saccharopolyspora sp. NPDC050642]|uniref:hypothetical protein n=1 Tax=Saccharopolyspora sp. NPDC050642 TaxID=3157099 RepID=UPI0033F75BDD
MDDRLRLAALRARRTSPAPREVEELRQLHAAADGAGRRLVEVRSQDDRSELVMGWLQDNALTPDDPGGPTKPSVGETLVLVACLRACWPDPDEPLYPGGTTTVAEIGVALEPLGVKGTGVTRALNSLRARGFLAADTADDIIRLGPEIALWREADAAVLRREYRQLPTAGRTQ